VVEPRQGRLLIVIELVIALLAQPLDAIGAAENLPVADQCLVFSGNQRGAGQLGQLELDQFQPRSALAAVHPQPVNLLPEGVQLVERARYLVPEPPEMTELIEHEEVLGGIEQLLVLMLTVQLHQPVGQILQCRRRGEGAIDERSAAPLGGDLAAHDQLRPVAWIENGFDSSELLAGSQEILCSSTAEQKADRLDENGFAGTGFAGEHVERGFEFDGHRLDDREVADGEIADHQALGDFQRRAEIPYYHGFDRISRRVLRLLRTALLPSSALPNRLDSEGLLPTPGSFVLALQLNGSATSTQAAAGGVVELVTKASPISQAVLVILLLFSVVAWAIIASKLAAFRKVDRQTAQFIQVFRTSGKFSDVQSVCASLAHSPLVGMFQAGYAELNAQLRQPATAAGSPGTPSPRPTLKSLAAVDRALLRASSAEVNKLEKSVTFLATTASITPFIGLFGTVWGIMSAFSNIGAQGSTDLAVVAPGIAEALIATAAGLFAAIPAVYFYNHLTTRVKVFATDMDDFALEFLNIAERNFT
jgi:biopolymer transport protein TolQ